MCDFSFVYLLFPYIFDAGDVVEDSLGGQLKGKRGGGLDNLPMFLR